MSTDCCKNLIEKPGAKEHFVIRNGKKKYVYHKNITTCGLHFVFSSGFIFYLLSRKLGNNYKMHNHFSEDVWEENTRVSSHAVDTLMAIQ